MKKKLYKKLLKLIPSGVKQRIKIILYGVMLHWKFEPCDGCFFRQELDADDVSLDEQEKIFGQMDDVSRKCVKQFFYAFQMRNKIHRVLSTVSADFLLSVDKNRSRGWRGHPEYLKELCHSQEELTQLTADQIECRKAVAKFKLPIAEAPDPSALVYHHGLRDLPESVKNYIVGTAFLDIGAYIGDSAISMLEYKPSKIFSFEPAPGNLTLYKETMKNNSISEDMCMPVAVGVGEYHEKLPCALTNLSGCNLQTAGNDLLEIITIDDFCQNNPERIGVVKVDIEGMEQPMLRGAKKALVKNRPVLLISIYHSVSDFLEIYPWCENLLPDYVWQIRHFHPGSVCEYYLIGYPREGLQS